MGTNYFVKAPETFDQKIVFMEKDLCILYPLFESINKNSPKLHS